MKMIVKLKGLVVLASAALLVSCGGGGGSSLYTPETSASAPASAAANNLILELSKATVANTGADSVAFTATALNNSVVVGGVQVAVTADGDAIVASGSSSTGTEGTVTGTVRIGSNKANRTVTVTAALPNGLTRTASFQVIGARLVGTAVPAVVSPGAAGQVQYRLTDQTGGAIANQPITITAANMTPATATGTTGTTGDFVFNYTAPATAGSYTVSASAGGASDSQTIQVQGSTTVVGPASGTPTSASVSANPSVVGVNTAGSTTSRSEIRALFLTTGNVPVRNVRVRFDLAGDLNAVGGSFTTAGALVLSDVNGVASTSYIAGTRASPTNGVTVRACYSTTDFAAGTCPNAASATLTLTSEPLGVSIGTNELVIVNELTYVKKFIVSVVDSAGAAKAGVDLAVSVDLTNFRKGRYAVPVGPPAGTSWVKQLGGVFNLEQICLNEDVNRNGVLEAGEDLDSDSRLEPGKSDVSVALLQAKTRADGTAELQIQYPKNYGTWVDAVITVAASGVSGTEGRATYVAAPVPVDTESIRQTDQAPAYILSPYGVQAGCSNPN